MENKIYAKLNIFSDIPSFDEFTEKIALCPSKLYYTKESIKPGEKHLPNRWEFKTEVVSTWDTRIVGKILTDTFMPRLTLIQEYFRNYGYAAIIYIVIAEVGEVPPLFELNHDLIQMAYELDATVAFDGIYNYP